ncbi:MAG: efflux RND transporter periplasmic adaptor subunit [Candidatus Brocadiaceae bacterium]|nr:efflux RND transporter periplasmic adaptor subunit [Candidatus Brocadiaceae bacterium]
MIKKLYPYLFILLVLVYCAPALRGENTKQASPAKVVVSEVFSGMLVLETEFIGTVYYLHVSDVASEVSGKVDHVYFEEGVRTKKGDVLVKINSDLLKETIKIKKASYGQAITDLELSKRNLRRVENLYREETVSEQVYDEHLSRVAGLEKKTASIKAELDRDRVEMRKKFVKSPYNGVVIKKHVDVGEWLSPGLSVATVACDDIVDVVVNVPQELCQYIRNGVDIPIEIDGKTMKGSIFAIIPQADISTRTFPVRIRIENTESVFAGMEAKVMLPRGHTVKTLMVERDAIIHTSGKNVVFAVIGLHAKMVPVKVIGYSGMTAGIESAGLEQGMKVVIKGNERLMDGNPVTVIKEGN